MGNLIARAMLVLLGLALGVAIVAAGGFWRARPRAAVPAPAPLPPASVPSGSYTAPGTRA